MWTTTKSITFEAKASQVWEQYENLDRWHVWDQGLLGIRANGPFEVGTTIVMTLDGPGDIELLLTVVEPNRRFVTTSGGPGVEITFDHTIEPVGESVVVSHTVSIDGPAADQVGPQMGPMITHDLPETLDAIRRAIIGS